jgi:glycosyltransferase involved in cell wall biosynthesis
MSDFTVLMSVYYKEKPEFLRQSLDSIFSQTLLPSEVVLVQDGPIGPELETVVKEFLAAHSIMKTVKLPKGQGLGIALSEGLKHCSHDLIARMDSDDISKPRRFEEQIAWMDAHPDVDVCGCWIDEFLGDIHHVVSSRRPPEGHYDIVSFGRKRNPINHPTVVFRRQAVERVGSYQQFYLFEDYFLWVRMILAGSRFHNLQQSLLYFRMTENMFHRRGGFAYTRSEIRLQRTFRRMGYISWMTMVNNIVCRSTVRNLPNRLRKFIYIVLLRR